MSSLKDTISQTVVLIARATTTTGSDDKNDQETDRDRGSNSSSPLLFFVALGFGVVFTNLWIIVGVKYCFRYNARNRAARLSEEGEPINMENMPRPHRRRREKKLMTMDEVNDKFPMMKYKAWVSSRAHEGLPTAGGIDPDAARPAATLGNADGILPDASVNERTLSDNPSPSSQQPADNNNNNNSTTITTATSREASPTRAAPTSDGDDDDDNINEKRQDIQQQSRPVSGHDQGQPSTNTQRVDSRDDDDDDDDDDEHINAALPPDRIQAPGDSCAICIDTLEDDDDVRGLTCGHAFHAGCIDPWLTSRRACCPLCKADYYIPKPRPNQDGQDPNAASPPAFDAPANSRLNLPTVLRSVFRTPTYDPQITAPPRRSRRRRARADNSAPGRQRTASTREVGSSPGMFAYMRSALRFGSRGNDRTTGSSTQQQAEVTPSQLESGTARA